MEYHIRLLFVSKIKNSNCKRTKPLTAKWALSHRMNNILIIQSNMNVGWHVTTLACKYIYPSSLWTCVCFSVDVKEILRVIEVYIQLMQWTLVKNDSFKYVFTSFDFCKIRMYFISIQANKSFLHLKRKMQYQQAQNSPSCGKFENFGCQAGEDHMIYEYMHMSAFGRRKGDPTLIGICLSECIRLCVGQQNIGL